jgi:hypothetical protein
VKSVPNASKRVELCAKYETERGSEAKVRFAGDIEDATPLKDFLERELRASKDSLVEVLYQLTFAPPLATTAESADALIERLTRLAAASAEVVAVPDVPSARSA